MTYIIANPFSLHILKPLKKAKFIGAEHKL